MCQRITCSSCGKPSYAGCGRHVEAVLGDVAPAKRCHCREQSEGPETGRPARLESWLRSLGAGDGDKAS